MVDGYSERLFSYGTLQQEAVQLANFGRILQGSPDAVTGYRLASVKISDPDVVTVSTARSRMRWSQQWTELNFGQHQ